MTTARRRGPRPRGPPRCVYRLAGKRVWDTRGSPCGGVSGIFAGRRGSSSNLIPRTNRMMIPRMTPQWNLLQM